MNRTMLALGAGLATHPIHFALERIELSFGLSFELARLFAGTVDRALTLVEERDGGTEHQRTEDEKQEEEDANVDEQRGVDVENGSRGQEHGGHRSAS